MKIWMGAAVALIAALQVGIAFAQDEDDYSRQELFSVVRSEVAGEDVFSLPSNFAFPLDARERSVFVVDFSHHNTDGCGCVWNWASIAKQSVAAVYLKATQGSSFTDKAAVPNAKAIAGTPLDMGVYHFLTADQPVEKQWSNFAAELDLLPAMQLPPALDLEWDPEDAPQDCPGDALITIRRSNGSVVHKCDKWGYVNSKTIIAMVNTWLDHARQKTGQEPVLYTSASWWAARIGKSYKDSTISAKVVWVADYTQRGLDSEDPREPKGANSQVWQFTDGASLPEGSKTQKIDASIFDGSLAEFRALVGAKSH